MNDQGWAITMKLPYVITYVCQNFDARDVRGEIPKSIYNASYFLPIIFPTIGPKLSLIQIE